MYDQVFFFFCQTIDFVIIDIKLASDRVQTPRHAITQHMSTIVIKGHLHDQVSNTIQSHFTLQALCNT